MSGTIQGTFGWDNAPFVNAMADAERIAQRGASNVQSKFLSIFRRSPNMRAERAFSGLAQSLASGDIAGGIESITARMTGLGVVAGVAIGAGAAIFMKFKEQIDATKAAHENLQNELVKRPISNVTSLSSEGMEQAFGKRQALINDLQEKQKKTFGSEVLAGLSQTAFTMFGADPGFSSDKPRILEKGEQERVGTQVDLNKAAAEQKQIMQAQADLALKMVSIKKEELMGDEHIARVRGIMLQAEQSLAGLKDRGLTHSAFTDASEAIRQNEQLSLVSENKRNASKERSMAIEEKIAKLVRGGLTAGDEKKVRAGLELQSIQNELTNANSPSQRRALLLQKAQKENEIRSFNKPEISANPFQENTISSRDFERAQESQKFNSQFAGLNLTQKEKDLKEPAQTESSEVVAAVKEGNDIMREVWMRK